MTTGENDYRCKDRFLLDPEEASFSDLFRLLISSELEERRFIKCPEQQQQQQEQDFRRRWIIFISVLAQKLLSLGRQPMATMGNAMEMSLNLLSGNGGLFNLLLNLVTGKFQWPDKSSATFSSLLANIDTRTELDNSIKPGDSKYKASLSMMAAKISYENEAFIQTKITEQWKMKFLKFYDFYNYFREENPSTQAFMLQDTRANPNLIVVAFRGTSPFDADDWRTDVDLSWLEFGDMGQTHSGFMKALGLQKDLTWPKNIQQDSDRQFAYYTLRKELEDVLKKNPEAKLIVTGHSLGGALAILFAAVLMLHDEEWLLDRLDGVYTFGQPRVGDEKFGEFMKEKMRNFDVKYFRYVYSNDMAARVPYDDKTLLFKHFGPCLYFDCFYTGMVLPEEPNKNYFSLIWVLPKMMIAAWELVRGFILPRIKGPDYREGWVLRMWRVIGLVVPGLSAHAPQDYVNSTRLGSLPLDRQPQDPIDKQELKRD